MTSTSTTPVEILNKLLPTAIENNDMQILKWIFEQGRPTNLNECLMTAIKNNANEVVSFLVEKITNPPPPPKVVKRPLVVTDRRLSMSEIKVNVNKNSTLMVTLVENPKLFMMDLKSGVVSLEEINHQNEAGWTVLHYILRNLSLFAEYELMIQTLIEMGADLKLTTAQMWTPLMMACCNSANKEHIVELLLKQPQTDVNHKSIAGNTALHLACCHIKKMGQYSERVVKILLDHPLVNVNNVNDEGYSILMDSILSLANGRASIGTVKLLINAANLDVNKPDKQMFTPLMHATQMQMVEVVEMLLAHPQIKVNENNGSNALNFAYNIYQINGTSAMKMVRMFLNHPLIDINEKNISAKIFLMEVINSADNGDRKELLELLLKKGKISFELEEDLDLICNISKNKRKEFFALLKANGIIISTA